MTERKPDDLYDALRQRLADYGQEPPAPLWARIRAQLPPPVAQPQLRRRRRWAPVALVVLLMTVAGGTGWQWWRTEQLAGLATNRTRTKGPQNSVSIHRHQKTSEPAASSIANAARGTSWARPAQRASVATNKKAPVEAGTAPTTPAGLTMAQLAHASAPGTAPGVASSTASARKTVAPQALVGALATASTPGRAARRGVGRAGDGTAENQTGASASPAATPTASAQLAAGTITRASGMRKREPSPSATTPSPQTMAAARHRAPKESTASALAAATAPTALSTFANRKAAKRNHAAASASAAAFATAIASAKAPPVATSDSETNAAPAADVAASPQRPARRAAETDLLARRVAVQLPGWPVPVAPQLVALAPSTLPLPFVQRWTVQVLAGPALTYRQLGAASQPSNITIGSPAINPASPTSTYRAASANVAELERPALGGGAQVSMRRALTPHWSLSGGLGYSEYATGLALQQVRAASNQFIPVPDSSTTSIHRRDTYRFVTLPVRVGYGWTLSGRWRLGVLAGADAAFYVGGSSTEGSACACQTQTWGPTGSPYRAISLGVSLGAEVRYRLTDRWEVLAQPTASYLLTPLARATAAYSERHLWGATGLLGVSFDLP